MSVVLCHAPSAAEWLMANVTDRSNTLPANVSHQSCFACIHVSATSGAWWLEQSYQSGTNLDYKTHITPFVMDANLAA